MTYSLVLGEAGQTGGVAVVDTKTNTRVTSLAFAGHTNPIRLALDAAAKRLYVANRGHRSVIVVDTINNKVINQIPVVIDPVDLVLVPTPSPTLSVSAKSLSFDPQSIGTTSPPQTLQLRNGGNAALIIQSTNMLGAGFRITRNTCQGATLLPASVCYLTLNFTPVAAGAYAATLTIASNDAKAPSVTIAVNGTVETRSDVTIDRISPTIGEGGTAVLIRGRNFGVSQGNGTVRVADMPASVTSWTKHRIEAMVPNRSPGVDRVVVSTLQGTSNAVDFTYATPDATVWRRLKGPWSRDCDAAFSTIAVHPSNPNLIYIASSAQGTLGCGVYVSSNAGITWRPINSGIPRVGVPPHYPSVSRIAIAPSDPKTIYLGTFVAEAPQTGRILKSINSGSSWVDASGLISPVAPVQPIHSAVLDIAVDPHHADTLYAATSGGVYKTTDGGKTWANMALGSVSPAPAVDDYAAVRIAPSNPDTVYVLGFTSLAGFALPCSLIIDECTEIKGAVPLPSLKSVDAGHTWLPITNPTTTPFQKQSLDALLTDLTIDPSKENAVIASTMSYIASAADASVITNNRGVFASSDDGGIWSAINGAATAGVSSIPISRLVSKPDVPAALLALTRTANTAFITTDNGMSWQRLTTLGLEDPTILFDVAFVGSKLYAATSRGVYVLDSLTSVPR